MKIKKHLKSILTYGFLLLVTIMNGQGIEIPDYEQRLSYTEFETEYYVIDQKDLNNVALSDKVKLKEMKYEREFDQLMNNNEERTTIISQVATEGVYEDWMEKPEVILIDKDGVSLYSFEGKRVNRIEHTPTYLELAEKASTDLLPTFIIPTREQLLKMENAGMEIMELENGFIQITFKSKQVIYNPDLLYLEKNDLNENGEVMHSIKTEFMQLPGGEIVFERVRESTVEDLKNNIKSEHVFVRLFSDYKLEDRSKKKNSAINEKHLSVISNVDQTKALLKYTPFSNGSSSTVTFYNTTGRVVKTIQVENSGLNEVDINDLSKGVYIIHIQSAGKTVAEKFVKM